MIRIDSLTQKWPIFPLGECADFWDHLRKPVKSDLRKEGPYPYYGANGQQGTIDNYLFDEDLVLLAEDGGFFGQEGRTIAYRISGKTWVNNHAHVLRPKKGFCVDFLCKILEYYDVTPFITGTTRAKLNKSDASRIPIPRPPLEEQRRIAAILDKADAICRKRQEALKLADDLVKSQFIEMFGDPVTNPMGWEVKPLGDVYENLDSRRVPITSGDRKKGIYPYYGASGIVDYVEDYIFNEDLLLVSEDGANLLARVTPIAFSVSGKIWVNNHAHVLRFSDKGTQIYVENFINRIDISPYITGTAQPKLNQAQLNAIQMPLPPPFLQNRFAKFVEQADKSKFAMQRQLEEAGATKKALMQEYFQSL
jgi:type I restriction enzyme S subunit